MVRVIYVCIYVASDNMRRSAEQRGPLGGVILLPSLWLLPLRFPCVPFFPSFDRVLVMYLPLFPPLVSEITPLSFSFRGDDLRRNLHILKTHLFAAIFEFPSIRLRDREGSSSSSKLRYYLRP